MTDTSMNRAARNAQPPAALSGDVAEELCRYDEHLRDVRGLSPGTRGPCITSPYQIAPAVAATKLRFSAGGLAEPRQLVLLQQVVDGRARQAAARDRAGGFEQLPDLPDRAPGIVVLGGENGRLGGSGQFRLPVIDARFRRQTIDALRPPSVVPRLDHLLAQMAAAGVGNGVPTPESPHLHATDNLIGMHFYPHSFTQTQYTEYEEHYLYDWCLYRLKSAFRKMSNED